MEEQTAPAPLLFEIVSAHIFEKDLTEKRHVLYSLRIRHSSGNDLIPAILDRRYTQFHKLYTSLRREFPELLMQTSFPRKVLLGNFDNKLISTRSTGFEALLQHVSSEAKLRTSPSLLMFLQEPELNNAKLFLANKQYSFALPILENNLRVLNNVYLDRSTPVLLALCRLLGCCVAIPDCVDTLKWADLALHRYKGVSDGDLLELYVPLLHTCITVWVQNGREKEPLEQTMGNFLKQGVRFNPGQSLLEVVGEVETKLSGVS